MAKQRKRLATQDAASAEDRWHLAAAGTVVALIAMLTRFFDDELAALIDAEDRTGVVRVAQAVGLAAVALGLVGLWRKEVEVLCGAAIVLGAVAIFFDFFVFVAFVALLIALCVALYRIFFKR